MSDLRGFISSDKKYSYNFPERIDGRTLTTETLVTRISVVFVCLFVFLVFPKQISPSRIGI